MRRACITLAILAIALSLIPAAAEATAPAQLSPAAESLSACVQKSHRLSVLMLIDESGSLRTTDPFNQRVDGIRAALTGLAGLSATSVDGKQPEVSVLMAGFYGLVHPDPEEDVPDGAWKPVNGEDVEQLLDEAGQYESLNHGKSTDYATALIAAEELLDERTTEQIQDGAAAPCEALIWFTDGRYSIPRRIGKQGTGLPLTLSYAPGVHLDQPKAGARAIEAGVRAICRPGGVMDELQGNGVVRFTVALATELSPINAAFLEAVTTGQGKRGERCGSHLSPLSGEYLTTDDGDQLFFLFADLVGSSPPVRVHSVCPRLSCVRGLTTFDTVPGLSQFLIRASGSTTGAAGATPPALELELNGPKGQSVTLDPDGPSHLSLADTEITQRWVSDRAVEVQGEFSTDKNQWLGRWSYAFVDPTAVASAPPAKSYSSVQLFADLAPAADGRQVLIRGSPTPLEFKLVHGSSPGDAVTTGPLVHSAHLIATVEDPVAGTRTPVPVEGPSSDGTFSATVKIPSSSTASRVNLGLTASFSTPSGTPIAPQYRSFDVDVQDPPGQGFPTISPSSLDLPALRGGGEVEGELTIEGNPVSSGCVWLGAPEVEAPSEAGEVEATILPAAGSAEDCIRVAKGEERKFTVRFDPEDEASGTVSASIPVHLRSDIVDAEHVVSIPASFAMAPVRDVGTLVAVLVALMLLGAALPLLLLHVLNRRGAHFVAPNRLRAVEVAVEMTRGGPLRRHGDEAAAELGRGNSLAAQGTRPVRELELGGLAFEAVASGSLEDRTFELFSGPYGVVRGAGRTLVAGAAQPLRSWQDGAAHEVPLSLVGTWIFRLDQLRQPEAGGPERAAGAGAEAPPAGSVPGEGSFFAAPSRPQPERAEAPRRPQGATIEGRLVLLISDGPPVDQAEVLFGLAEEGLRTAERLWRQEEPEPERPPASPPEGPDGDVAPVEPPPPPSPPKETEWKPSSGPEKRPGKKPGGPANRDFY